MNELRQLIDSYHRFRNRGWAPGGLCAIACLSHVTDNSKKIYITPDQIQDQLSSNDIFLLRDLYGTQDIQTPLNQIDKSIKLSRWAPVLLEILAANASNLCVAQLSPLWSTLAAKYALTIWAKKGDAHPNILRLSYWKLLEKLTGDETSSDFLIPIINYGQQDKILPELRENLRLYPHTCAIIIRDYGLLVWGKSFADVFNRVEVIEHLCQLQIQDSLLFDKINSA